MDGLPTLSLAFLLVFISTAAFAQTTLNATSGSMVLQFANPNAPFTAAGSDFSYSGSMAVEVSDPIGGPFPTGSAATLFVQADTFSGDLGDVSLTVHGAPWGLVPFDSASVAGVRFLTGPFVFSGPGTFYSTFTFDGSFVGAPLSVLSAHPGEGCSLLPCVPLSFQGDGTVRYDVVPFPSLPAGALEIQQATFTFVPEPSTASLLLIALAGLAIAGGRRTFRARLFPAG